jgi:hypothetical protein
MLKFSKNIFLKEKKIEGKMKQFSEYCKIFYLLVEMESSKIKYLFGRDPNLGNSTKVICLKLELSTKINYSVHQQRRQQQPTY